MHCLRCRDGNVPQVCRQHIERRWRPTLALREERAPGRDDWVPALTSPRAEPLNGTVPGRTPITDRALISFVTFSSVDITRFSHGTCSTVTVGCWAVVSPWTNAARPAGAHGTLILTQAIGQEYGRCSVVC